MHMCLHLDNVITSGEPNNSSDLVTQKFFWILGYNMSL